MKAIKATVTKDLTDYQLVEAAERLINFNPKNELPRNYTLKDLLLAEQRLNAVAAEFIDKYGPRLEGLAPDVHRTISHWKLL